MSANLSDFEVDYAESYPTLLKPSRLILLLEIISVICGIAIGIFGIVRSTSGATANLEHIMGALGYVLTSVVPIACYQVFSISHKKNLANNQFQPYDLHGGESVQNQIAKVALVGLIGAGFSIWLFFLPLAEALAG